MRRAQAYLLAALAFVGVVSCTAAGACDYSIQHQPTYNDPNDPGHWTNWTAMSATPAGGACTAAPLGLSGQIGWHGSNVSCSAGAFGPGFGGEVTFTGAGYATRWRSGAGSGSDCSAVEAEAADEPDPDPEPDVCATEFCAQDAVTLCWKVIGCWAAAWVLKLLAFAARPNE